MRVKPLQQFLVLTWQQRIYFFVWGFLNLIAFVLSPFILKATIEGIFPSEDRATLWTLVLILFGIEAVAFFSNYFFQMGLEDLNLEAQRKFKTSVLEFFGRSRSRLSLQSLQSLLHTDSKKFFQNYFVLRIQSIKDLMTVVGLFLVSSLVNLQTGVAMLVFGVGIFFVHYLWQKKTQRLAASQRSGFFEDWLSVESVLEDLRPLRRAEDREGALKKIRSVYDEQHHRDRSFALIRTQSRSVARFSRIFLVVVAMISILVSQEQLASSVSLLWAMMFIAFRVASPLENLLRWPGLYHQNSKLGGRISHALSDLVTPRPNLFQKGLKKLFQKTEFRSDLSAPAIEVLMSHIDQQDLEVAFERWASESQREVWLSVSTEDFKKDLPSNKLLCGWNVYDEHHFPPNLKIQFNLRPSGQCWPLVVMSSEGKPHRQGEERFLLEGAQILMANLRQIDADYARLTQELEKLLRLGVPISMALVQRDFEQRYEISKVFRVQDYRFSVTREHELFIFIKCPERDLPLAVNRILGSVQGKKSLVWAQSFESVNYQEVLAVKEQILKEVALAMLDLKSFGARGAGDSKRVRVA